MEGASEGPFWPRLLVQDAGKGLPNMMWQSGSASRLLTKPADADWHKV
jgi:hypothetical protein